jgi:hypothetical protein
MKSRNFHAFYTLYSKLALRHMYPYSIGKRSTSLGMEGYASYNVEKSRDDLLRRKFISRTL